MSQWRPDKYASLTIPRYLVDYIRAIDHHASMAQTIGKALRFYIWFQQEGDMNLKRECDKWWRDIEKKAAEQERLQYSKRYSGA